MPVSKGAPDGQDQRGVLNKRLKRKLTNEGNVVDGIGVLEAGLVGETAKGRDAGEHRVGLQGGQHV